MKRDGESPIVAYRHQGVLRLIQRLRGDRLLTVAHPLPESALAQASMELGQAPFSISASTTSSSSLLLASRSFYYMLTRLRDELDDTTSLVDLPLCTPRHEPSFYDQRLIRRQTSLSENLSVSVGEGVDDWYEFRRGGGVFVFGDKGLQEGTLSVKFTVNADRQVGPYVELIEVDDWAPEEVVVLVEVPHTDCRAIRTSETVSRLLLPVLD